MEEQPLTLSHHHHPPPTTTLSRDRCIVLLQPPICMSSFSHSSRASYTESMHRVFLNPPPLPVRTSGTLRPVRTHQYAASRQPIDEPKGLASLSLSLSLCHIPLLLMSTTYSLSTTSTPSTTTSIPCWP